ncbi:MAG: hypothetical protein H7301_14575 [Cryobacterium sp.]|nr:hypothetical protein [Oligoflexia bacterium]
MPKKPVPAKAKAKIPAKGATKKAGATPLPKSAVSPAKKTAPLKTSAKAPAKLAPAPKALNVKVSNAKASLKPDTKKDVKSSAPMSATATSAKAGKMEENAKSAKASIKASKPVKGAELAAAVPAPGPALTRAPKVAKGKGVKAPRAPKNYEDMCREIACESSSTTAGYCRLHYIKNWKKIKRKELILKEKKLNQYIEELVSKYPDKYIEAIKLDLTDEKAFSKVIYDLELDENVDEAPNEDEADESIIDNIKREFDDGDTDF